MTSVFAELNGREEWRDLCVVAESLRLSWYGYNVPGLSWGRASAIRLEVGDVWE